MSDEKTNAIRDVLITSAPNHESTIRSRDEVVSKWCAERGVPKDELSIEQILEIRALPEWKNAS